MACLMTRPAGFICIMTAAHGQQFLSGQQWDEVSVNQPTVALRLTYL